MTPRIKPESHRELIFQEVHNRRDDEWRDNYMTIEMKMAEKFEERKKITILGR